VTISAVTAPPVHLARPLSRLSGYLLVLAKRMTR